VPHADSVFQVHVYCLTRNHLPVPGTADRFSLVVETPHANRVAGMRWLWSSYTISQIAQRLHMGSWKSLNNKLY
jgi:hypothetical protein